MVKIGIIGATGYGGVELVRILSQHPQVELSYLSSETYADQPIDQVYPHLGDLDITCHHLDLPEATDKCDLVFFALPHGKAMELVPQVLSAGKQVVDLSADFRLQDPSLYEEWYGFTHTCPELLSQAVFGIPELYRSQIKQAKLVAGAGCYPTGVILPLAPLLKAGLIQPEGIVIDSKSGVSGAGRTSLKLEFHFPEAEGGMSPYNVLEHRHIPEIEQELSVLAGSQIKICFTPHLAPMSRGILTTIYAGLTDSSLDTEDLLSCLAEFYGPEPFIKVLGGDQLPGTKATQGSNYLHLTARVDPRTGQAKLFSALDNLGKGMSGQAVQAMNLMLGYQETTALDRPGLYP